MTDIGELVVRIKADAAQLQQELQRATASTKQSANEMVAAFDTVKASLETIGIGIGITALVEFGKSAFESADNLEHMSNRIGIAASTLSALQIPLKQNGSSIEEFASSMNFLNRILGAAAQGNVAAIQRFDDLGLSVRKLLALNPQDQFYAVAKALSEQGNQADMSRKAFEVMGRSVAPLLPTIKELGGNMKEFVDNAKRSGDALTSEQIEKVHEMDAAWVSAVEHMKIWVVDVGLFIKEVVDDVDQLQQAAWDIANWARNPLGSAAPYKPDTESQAAWEAKSKQMGFVTTPTVIPSSTPTSSANDNNARGSNADLLPPPKDSELKAYIANIGQETAALNLNQKALAVSKAEIEGAAKAKADFDNGIRSSKTLTDSEKQQIDDLAASYYDLKKAQQEAEQEAKKMQETLASALADMVTDWQHAGASITSVLKNIANEIIKNNIATPFSKSIVGDPASGQSGLFSSLFSSSGGGSSFFSSIGNLLHFADGGSPPVGVPSLVGENGPELFVPNSAGTIVPNGGFGGSSVVVQQTINMSPGLPETVNAAIRNAAPGIAAAAHAGVMQSLQRGGPESKIVGKRAS